jgi:hypothetical protein
MPRRKQNGGMSVNDGIKELANAASGVKNVVLRNHLISRGLGLGTRFTSNPVLKAMAEGAQIVGLGRKKRAPRKKKQTGGNIFGNILGTITGGLGQGINSGLGALLGRGRKPRRRIPL